MGLNVCINAELEKHISQWNYMNRIVHILLATNFNYANIFEKLV